ncbi:hypothetical protein Lesp02_11910 [Lentzea sp. NBRC 105346]|uniref:helix-turn-helix domain-containing protein n=1 Tax=Lentzea sp. NBRC 105346 TaxID=3032205 RepID=UPI00249FF6D4|nr:helix-turn-helix domain-containing protein [Lentzea sp. NBRC 105346]GLZ29001.1 hypothetical protein Lesp02_11910 [Lentzea sp. NBRC 105346]
MSSGDLVARLREELRPVYRDAARNAAGWEKRAVAVASSTGERLAEANVGRSHLVAALRLVDRLLTQTVALNMRAAVQVAAAGTIVGTEMLSAYHERRVAAVEPAGWPVPPAGSTVVAVRAAGSSPADVEKAFRDLEPDVVARLSGAGSTTSGHLLLPLAEVAATELCGRAHDELFGSVWLCVSGQTADDLPVVCKDVDELLDLVTSLGRPPGVYRLDDVLFEYAAVSTPEVTAELSRIVTPLLANPVLVETLMALVESDGNRAVAVKRLFIHRSTIDYRLWQVEQLTGLSPVHPRDLAMLSIALDVCGRVSTK